MANYILQKEQLYDSIKGSTFSLPDTLTVRASESSDPEEIEYTVVVPGGLLGILSIWLAASTTYGFQIDTSKFTQTIVEITHQKIEGSPQYLNMLKEQRDNLNISLAHIKFLESNSTVLKQINTRFEGGIFLVKGLNGLKSAMNVTTDTGTLHIFVYVFHQTQLNNLNRLLAQKCIESSAISLFDGQDEEYLYEVVSDTADEFFYESIRYFCKGLPLYLLQYKDEGGFETTEQGLVE
jgi:hypothetical protein